MSKIQKEYNKKLKSKLFGLLNEREKNRDWENFLESILIELINFTQNMEDINYYILYYKLSTCKYLSFKYYRKTIFECMELIDRIDA